MLLLLLHVIIAVIIMIVVIALVINSVVIIDIVTCHCCRSCDCVFKALNVKCVKLLDAFRTLVICCLSLLLAS